MHRVKTADTPPACWQSCAHLASVWGRVCRCDDDDLCAEQRHTYQPVAGGYRNGISHCVEREPLAGL